MIANVFVHPFVLGIGVGCGVFPGIAAERDSQIVGGMHDSQLVGLSPNTAGYDHIPFLASILGIKRKSAPETQKKHKRQKSEPPASAPLPDLNTIFGYDAAMGKAPFDKLNSQPAAWAMRAMGRFQMHTS
jgi:hypothetical protein